MKALTIAHSSEITNAMVLAQSVLDFHPDWQVTVLVAADRLEPGDAFAEGIAGVTPAELGIGDLNFLTAALDREQLINALRGPAIEALLDDDDGVVYLDRRLRAVGSLDALASALERAPIALVGELPPPGEADEPGAIVRGAEERGVLHPGVMALRDSAAATALLGAWPGRGLAIAPRSDRIAHEHRDARPDPFQTWLDRLPTHTGELAPLAQPLFVAGAWNLRERVVEDRDGHLESDGDVIALVDFSRFDTTRPHLLASDDGPRLSASPALAGLCADHAARLRAATANSDPYTHLADGTPLTPILRWLAGEAFGSGALDKPVFSERGTAGFYAWLNEPASAGAAAGITRYHEAIWSERIDIRVAFPHLDGPGGPEFAAWLRLHGVDQFALPDVLLAPLPINGKHRRARAAGPPGLGVNVAGFLRSELGIGEAARLVIGALETTPVPVLPVQGELRPSTRHGVEHEYARPAEARHPINLICMNGNTIPMFARDAGREFFANRYSIALWWWELSEFPEDWRAAFDFLDEIWVASDHVYRAIAPHSPRPVLKLPMPVTLPPIEAFSRAQLGLPEDDFTFLYMYDYHSTAARKNPVGAVRAFKAAFAPGSGASLVLKCINAERLPEHHEEVLVEIGERSDIHVLDRFVSPAEKDALLAACDCYLSLHRSEGFGLTPAEAMWLGKPVIATRYGGTLEFMTDENAYLVDYSSTAVGPHAYPYPPDALWADPDLEQAAQLMRHVFEHQSEAADRGRRAAEDLRAAHAPSLAGQAMEQRLRTIHRHLPAKARTAGNGSARRRIAERIYGL